MSGEDDSDALVTSATATMMTAVQAMFTELRDSMNNNNLIISNNINDINNTMNNNINDINNSMNNNNNHINKAIETMQVLHEASRAELLERIDQRSRLSTRATTRAGSRAVSPKSLMAGVNAKLKSDADTPDVLEAPQGITEANALPERQRRPSQVEQAYVAETPRVNSFGPDLTLTQVFRDKDAAVSQTGTTPTLTVTHLMPRTGPTIPCIVNSSRGRLQYAKQSWTVLLPSRSVSPSRKTSWTSRTSSMSKSDSPHTCPMISRRK